MLDYVVFEFVFGVVDYFGEVYFLQQVVGIVQVKVEVKECLVFGVIVVVVQVLWDVLCIVCCQCGSGLFDFQCFECLDRCIVGDLVVCFDFQFVECFVVQVEFVGNEID